MDILLNAHYGYWIFIYPALFFAAMFLICRSIEKEDELLRPEREAREQRMAVNERRLEELKAQQSSTPVKATDSLNMSIPNSKQQ